MKIKLLTILLLSVSLYGQNLSEILQAFKSSKKVEVLKEQSTSNIAKSEQFDTYEIPELGFGLSQADEIDDSGLEYSVGVSHSVTYPFSSKGGVVDSDVKSIKQKLKHDIHLISLDIASKYHKACVSKEISDRARVLYKEQESRFVKLELLYDLGEISKKDLLFNKLDLVKLKQKISSYKMDHLSELGYLQEMIDNIDIQEISCNDLEVIKKDIVLEPIKEHAKITNLKYKQNSVKKLYSLNDSLFRSLSYELLYEKELGADRYTVGFSLPLDLLSSKKEKEKSEYLHKSYSLLAQEQYLSSNIKKASNASLEKIATIYDQYELLNEKILPMSLELKNLAKIAFDEGEGDVLEYLDATRSYSENLLEMLRIKQNYYDELFELYKKADLDLGEKS